MAVGDGTNVATASMEEKIHDHARGRRGEGGREEKGKGQEGGRVGLEGNQKSETMATSLGAHLNPAEGPFLGSWGGDDDRIRRGEGKHPELRSEPVGVTHTLPTHIVILIILVREGDAPIRTPQIDDAPSCQSPAGPDGTTGGRGGAGTVGKDWNATRHDDISGE
ncbi:hypothetical protein BO94DRAFT_225769 [Aspergillus sclerotioniger CBS 115572]|uniref:Uncharacterized protein n=1 Tax=Aspergillus sclerotioniger CBS 115572 TaxID=1450535 RepID=A0A317X9T1_9EURO|nr:hypothetical protein BO94DRAFT_225769 [Aspergillus sclerotioniger CBS 115572]PWY95363.1 hypothetical protein BO94DRAFT_225769 [Aspergillus sclerotioniger CBS 115572]